MGARYFVRPALRSTVGRGIDTLERIEQIRVSVNQEILDENIRQSISHAHNSTLGRDASAIAIALAGGDNFGSHPASFAPQAVDNDDLVGDVQGLYPDVYDRLVDVSDARRFRPAFAGFITRGKNRAARLVAGRSRLPWFVPHGIGVDAKEDALICIRRKNRRGTLLALGQGGGYHRPPRRSPTSDIWC